MQIYQGGKIGATFMTVSVVVSGLFQSGVHAFTRISSAIPEPVGLVLLGVSLIALSWLVRRKVHSSKRR